MASDSRFRPGDTVSYFGGEGTVIRVEDDILHIHTDDGEVVEHKSNLPMVSKQSAFESGERVKFPGGEGEILKIEERPDRADLLYVHTESDDLKTVPADKQGVEALAGVSDKLSRSHRKPTNPSSRA
ncbi:hypothetical protein [Haloarcula sp. CGMCC 1.2071]|uniref:hypothetical protein n=1 Tax=Haloarcula sp. CGMCC 1.2071 TaxID=3111454 RepID=UPI00300E9693